MKQLRGFNGHDSNGNSDVTNEMLSQARKKYGGMDENALIAQLLNNVKTQKQNGTYDPTQLLSFVNSISPTLTPEQRTRLESVITVLNNGENV